MLFALIEQLYIAARNARLSREHAARRTARLEREAVEAFTRATFAAVEARGRNPYPFHA